MQAYVLRYWPALTETFVVREIDALTRQGVPVVVVALGTRPDGALADGLPDVEVLRPPRGWALARVWGWNTHKHGARVDWAAKELRARGVQRLHAHFAGEAAVFARDVANGLGVPWSVTVHAVDLFKPAPGLTSLLAEARPAVTVCAHHQAWIARRYGVHAPVVRCGVAQGGPIADPSRDPPVVIAVLRDVPKKDPDRLVRATRALGVPLRIVGDAHRLAGPGVTVGPARPSEVPALLASAQLFALPCRVAPDGDRDGVPVAMIEALRAGLPVVTRPVAGIPELVDDAVGWVDADFEGALEHAVRTPSERVRRGANGPARAGAWGDPDASARALQAAWSAFAPRSPGD